MELVVVIFVVFFYYYNSWILLIKYKCNLRVGCVLLIEVYNVKIEEKDEFLSFLFFFKGSIGVLYFIRGWFYFGCKF